MLQGGKGNREFARTVVFLWCGCLVLVSCGGKKGPQPVAGPSGRTGPASAGRDQPEGIPQIRLLLKESFSSAKIADSDLAAVIMARVSQGKIYLSDSSGRMLASGSGFRLQPRSGRLLKLDGVSYRGALEVFINPVKKPVIVNDLDLETYLRGVVPNELSPTAYPHLQAIKAQTVAARTFALSNLGLNARKGFDLYSDSRSQTYRGRRSEQTLSDRAVKETRGMVAVYRKKPIVAFYSSTCGGLTASYHDMFQRPEISYLRGGAKCPDQDSPHRSWKSRISVTDVQPALDRLGIGRLKKLVPMRKSRHGRIVEMKFVGSKGEKVLKGLKIRSALKLRSNWITDLNTRKNKSKYIREIRAEGRGWGHGVGLCQMGTVKLAERGWKFERILKHYYSRIEMDRRW